MPPLYQKQFKWQDDLIHNVGLLFMKKDWVIKEIVYHPLKFAKRHMEDEVDPRPIRIRYFATFVMKKGKSKIWLGRYRELFYNYEKYKHLVAEYGFDVDTEERYHTALEVMAANKVYNIDNIYNKSLVMNESQETVKQNEIDQV
jgi:hypothetical protein